MAEGTFNKDKSGKPHDLELYHTIHNSRPDYTRPLLKIPAKARKRMLVEAMEASVIDLLADLAP